MGRSWLVAVVCAVGCGAKGRAAPPDDVIVRGHRAVAADAVVMIGFSLDDREWLLAADQHGVVRWRRALNGSTTAATRDGVLSIHEDAALVRYHHVKDKRAVDEAMAAYGLRDGAPRWDTTLVASRVDPSMVAPERGALELGGALVAAWTTDGAQVELHGVEAATGKVVSRQLSRQAEYAPLGFGTRLVTHALGDTRILDLAAGAPAVKLDATDAGCAAGDDYLTLLSQPESVALVAVRGADPARLQVLVPSFGADLPGSPRLRSCGRHGPRLALAIDAVDEASGDSSASLVITDLAGATPVTIPLGTDDLRDGTVQRHPRHAPLSGDLPRYALHAQHDRGQRRLMMIDFQRSAVAWTGRADATVAGAGILHVGDRWYVSGWPTADALALFDGTSGRLLAAVEVPDATPLEPGHFSDGQLWLLGELGLRKGTLPLVVLDARTLAVVSRNQLTVRDVTERALQSLGGSYPAFAP